MSDLVKEVSERIQGLMRPRLMFMRLRVAATNRLTGALRGELHRDRRQDEKWSEKAKEEAKSLAREVLDWATQEIAPPADKPPIEPDHWLLAPNSWARKVALGIAPWQIEEKRLLAAMEVAATELPAAIWTEHHDRRGFSL